MSNKSFSAPRGSAGGDSAKPKIDFKPLPLDAEMQVRVERLGDILASIAALEDEANAIKAGLRVLAAGAAAQAETNRFTVQVRPPVTRPASSSFSLNEQEFAMRPEEVRNRLLRDGVVRPATGYVVDPDGYEAMKEETKGALEKRGVILAIRHEVKTSQAAVTVKNRERDGAKG